VYHYSSSISFFTESVVGYRRWTMNHYRHRITFVAGYRRWAVDYYGCHGCVVGLQEMIGELLPATAKGGL